MKIDKRLFTYIRHMRLYIVTLGGLSMLAAVLIVLQAYFITTIINGVFLAKGALAQGIGLSFGGGFGQGPALSLRLFPRFGQGPALCLWLLLVVIGVRASLFWFNERLAQKMATQAKTALRGRLFKHLLKLGPIFMKGERTGELVNTATEGVETLDAYFSQVLPQVCATAIIPVIILVVIFANDPLSGIVLLVTLPILPIFMILIGKQAQAATNKRWYQLSQMSAHFLDVLQGATILKLFGRNQQQKEMIRQMSDRFGDTTLQVLRIAFLSALVMEMGATISMAIVAVEVGLRLLYGQMAFASAFLILLLMPEYYQPLRALGPQFHASMASAAGAKRIFDILDTPLPTTSTVGTGLAPVRVGLAPIPTIWAERTGQDFVGIEEFTLSQLSFEGVYYTYGDPEEELQPALQGVSFTMQRGQRVALVGPSGAGKTTIAHLLLRFIEPQKGTIRANGVSIQAFKAQDWRKLVAWQPQHPYLFNTTVAENIRMGRADASMDEVVAAAQKAHIHEVIETLPQGYNTIIGERGMRLSGGQIQRLSLARAFLKDAPLLILDEATSTLDIETEAHVLTALNTLMHGRIVLIIAHRLNTIRSADQILVIKEGNVIDSGTHTTLIQTSQAYQQLAKAYEDGKIVA